PPFLRVIPHQEPGSSRVPHPSATRQVSPRVRLACVTHAASVGPEPGSNSPSKFQRSLTTETGVCGQVCIGLHKYHIEFCACTLSAVSHSSIVQVLLLARPGAPSPLRKAQRRAYHGSPSMSRSPPVFSRRMDILSPSWRARDVVRIVPPL